MMADESGRIKVVFWNDQVDLFEQIKEGDILQVKSPFIKENQGKLEIHLNTSSETKTNPPA